jgi:chromosome segregation ATPase
MKRIVFAILLSLSGCSPIKSSAHDEKHQLELTLHEVQTNLDDLRHDINCFQAELQILDGRMKHNEKALATIKSDDLEKQQAKIDQLNTLVQSFEKRWSSYDKSKERSALELNQLSCHANETTAALEQCKSRIEELEKELISNGRRFDELRKIEAIAKEDRYKIYKVRPGDSLQKIAKAHKTAVEKIKKINGLEQDLIVVDQELKIPSE